MVGVVYRNLPSLFDGSNSSRYETEALIYVALAGPDLLEGDGEKKVRYGRSGTKLTGTGRIAKYRSSRPSTLLQTFGRCAGH